jgi:hypothetical protein
VKWQELKSYDVAPVYPKLQCSRVKINAASQAIAFRFMIEYSPRSPTPQLFQQTVNDSKRAIAERGETSVMRHNK